MSWEDVFVGLKLSWFSLVASMAVGAICAYIGVYIVLKRIVFVGASLAQISSAGIGLAFMTGIWIPTLESNHSSLVKSVTWIFEHPLSLSMAVTLLATLIFSQQTLSRKVPQESVIGIGYLVAYAMMVMFVAKSPKGMHEVEELLAGSIITITLSEFYWMCAVFAVVALAHLLLYKQFLFVSFDRDVAATQGHRVRLWDLLFYLILGVTISVSIQRAGLLLVFGYLVIPAVSGLVVARRMSTAFWVAIATSLVSTFVGFCWALKSDLPTSPPTIAIAAVILAILWVSRRFVREA
jgi:zinc/manganese transport system permease protein